MITAEERCNLICRVAEWCYDNVESFNEQYIGTGLAYLMWAIADRRAPASFDVYGPDVYQEFIRLLKSNPGGLWDTLVKEGFIHECEYHNMSV